MSVGTLIVFLDGTVINTALPDISTKLSATTSQLQWVVDAYILVLAGLLLLGGTIGDRFGRRRWMSIGHILFGGGSVLGGLSSTIATLIAARAAQGPGAALVLPATLSIVTNVFQRDERAKAIAIWTAVGGLGVGIGPAVGGYLVEHWDYSAAFWIHVPILALAGLGMVIVPESRDTRPVGLDVPVAMTGTLAVSSLVYAIITGWTVAQSLLAKVGPRRLVSTAMVIMGTGVALFTTVDAGTSTVRMIATLMIVGFGFGLAAQPLTDTVMAAVPVEDAGVGSAVNDVSRELGSALGVAIIGSIVSHLYRSDIETRLCDQVPGNVIDVAGEGIGVIHVAARSLDPSVATRAVAGADAAFVDAMTTGFWISVGFVAVGLLTSLFLLPSQSRTSQVVRADAPEPIEVPA